MDSPATSTADAAGRVPDTGFRRRLIGAGLLGIAGSLLPLASRAGAATPDENTTTTRPPQRPTDDDQALLGFGQEVELAAMELYDAALQGDVITEDVRHVFEYIRESHQAAGQQLSAMLGKGAPGTALESALSSGQAGFSARSLREVATAAAELENTAVATHTEMLGQLQGTEGSALIASMIASEARHATVLQDIAGETELDALLLSDATPLAAEKG
jgi:rubrerythrin